MEMKTIDSVHGYNTFVTKYLIDNKENVKCYNASAAFSIGIL